MTLLVLLIALIVIASNIIDYIQVNIKDLGVRKAISYTSGQLMPSPPAQFLGLSLPAAAAGAGLSYALFPGINDMMDRRSWVFRYAWASLGKNGRAGS